MTKADIKDEGKQDEPEKKEEEVLETLDQVHERTVAELENEDNSEEEDDDDQNDTGSKDGEDDEDDAEGTKKSDEDDTNDADDADDKPDTPAADDEEEEDKPPLAPAKQEDESAPELDLDPEKPGKGKIAVKSFDGKTYHFNNLEEVPEDFEPASYKEWGKAVQKFSDKDASEKQAAQDNERRRADEEKQQRISDIKAGWDKDIKQLTKSGHLPEDEKERKKVTDEVFAYMDEQLKKGRVVDFEPAYKSYMFDKGPDDKEADTKKKNDEKKARGSKVMGSGSGTSKGKGKGGDTGQGRVFESPPPGVTLDQVHENVLGSL